MKPPIPIYLAVEDDLSEWLLRRLLQERPVDYAVGPVFKRGGFGYLKQGPAYNSTLASYVNHAWQPGVASAKCPSLKKLLSALALLESDWKERAR